MSKPKYNDYLEKILTAVFGVIGITAVIIKLYINGLTIDNGLDAMKDLAGLVVVIAVFLVANRIFSLTKLKKFNFKNAFEGYIKDWASRNKHLVCENLDEAGEGESKYRYCYMMIDHSNLVTKRKLASEATPNDERGAFLALPNYEDGSAEEIFEIRFNPRSFARQETFKTQSKEIDLKTIIETFKTRIQDSFSDLGLILKAQPSNRKIIVNYSGIVHDDKNARALVDVVEFVKTMVLALS